MSNSQSVRVESNSLSEHDSKKSKRKIPHPTLKRDPYENYRLLDPQNQFLAYIPKKRFHWYLRLGLGSKVDESTLKLNFVPKKNSSSEFQKEKLKNICVVCGTKESLTRHHIVPYEYRRHLSLKYKSRNAHDIVAICSPCHSNYENEASKKKIELGKMFNAPLGGVGMVFDKSKAQVKRLAGSLLNARDKMPESRRKKVEDSLASLIDVDLYLSDKSLNIELMKQLFEVDIMDSSEYISHGNLVVNAILKDASSDEERMRKTQEFVYMWRKHFKDKAVPKYMSSAWDLNRPLEHD